MDKHLHPRCPLSTLAFAVMFSVWWMSANPASAQSTQPENKQDSVRGIVINSLSREPIGRALVYSPDNRFATLTDSEGRFEFTFAQAENKNDESGPANISGTRTRVTCADPSCTSTHSSTFSYSLGRNGPDQLMARKPGFLNEPNGIQTLQPENAGKDLTISLTPEALIVGRVVLASSEASDTIQLELYRRQVVEGRGRWLSAGTASSKSNGEFRFAELSPGTYKLLTRELMDRDPLTLDPRGQLYGYPPVYFPNATDFAAERTIQLAAGQIFQANISLVRHAYYRVKVPVANAPPGGVNVVVSAQGHRGPGYSLGYNNRDQTIEGALPNGNYTLEASGFGPNPSSGLLNISVKGAAVEGPRMTMIPNGFIAVIVKEEFTSTEDTGSPTMIIRSGPPDMVASGPRRYLYVNLEPADDFGQERTASLRAPSGPEDDSLVIDGVQPGRYWVKVNTNRGFVAAISSGTTDLLHQLLIVGLGGSSPPIEITMRDASAEIDGIIEGVAASVNGTEGAASSSTGTAAHVYLVPVPDSSGEFKDIWVPPDGKFGPQQVPPGTYRALAFDRPQEALEYHNPEVMRAYEAKGSLVRLVAGQKEHLHLQLILSSE